MKCSKCGFENDNDALFCENCGASLSCKKAKKDRNWRVFNNRKIKMAIKAIILICTPFLGWWFIMYMMTIFRTYDRMYTISIKGEGQYGVIERNHKLGVLYIGPNFDREVIPVKYDAITAYDVNFYVRLNDKWGIISKTGDILIQFKYEQLKPTTHKNLIVAKYGGKYGCIDYHDNIVIPFIYDNIDDISEVVADSIVDLINW